MSYLKAACRRCLSACRLRRESHLRTPYPSAKPMISTIRFPALRAPAQLENWKLMGKTPRPTERWAPTAGRGLAQPAHGGFGQARHALMTIKGRQTYMSLTMRSSRQTSLSILKQCCEKGTRERCRPNSDILVSDVGEVGLVACRAPRTTLVPLGPA